MGSSAKKKKDKKKDFQVLPGALSLTEEIIECDPAETEAEGRKITAKSV